MRLNPFHPRFLLTTRAKNDVLARAQSYLPAHPPPPPPTVNATLQLTLQEKWLIAKKFHPPVMTAAESLEILIRDRASFSRYGHCEYDICRTPHNDARKNSDQACNEKLQARLLEVLLADAPNFYAAMAVGDIYPEEIQPKYVDGKYNAGAHFQHYLAGIYPLIMKCGSTPRLCSPIFWWSELPAVQKMWQNRKVCLITNDKNFAIAKRYDYFANATALRFIATPARNAFDAYDEILRQAKQQPKDALLLLAFGPAAAVAAYDLHIAGHQAIDFGQGPFLNLLKNYQAIDSGQEQFLKRIRKNN